MIRNNNAYLTTRKRMFLATIGAVVLLLGATTSAAAERVDRNLNRGQEPFRHPKTFTVEEAAGFITSVFGSGSRGAKIRRAFEEQGVDGARLVSLEASDLEGDLGMPKLYARRFRKTLDELLRKAEEESEKTSSSSIESQENTNGNESDSNLNADDDNNVNDDSDNDDNYDDTIDNDDDGIVVENDDDDAREDDKTNENADIDADRNPTENSDGNSDENDEKTAHSSDCNKEPTKAQTPSEAKETDLSLVVLTIAALANADTNVPAIQINSNQGDKTQRNHDCHKLCAEQRSEHSERVPSTRGALRSAILDWGANPESSPHGAILGCWDVSEVTDFSGAFENIRSWFEPNDSLSCWDVSSATTMDRMFRNAVRFEGSGLETWDVSKVTSMRETFSGARLFTGHGIVGWDVSSVTDMGGMFFDAAAFNESLEDWNVSEVTTTAFMFAAATSFNKPLGAWDMGKVHDFRSMFEYALVFNQPLAGWNIDAAKHVDRMFNGAEAFDQNLCEWNKPQNHPSFQQPPMYKKKAIGHELFEGTSCPKRKRKSWCITCEQ
ncbi:unnamed protein product [Pseudo-nitzschia multistriata]|uniref:SAM domain-containing protein n=1 Tax=Pseudo-nitzschia multistriata TaxID=183589 RepID=A0A448ZPP6_9STRA|nr:unnamed protein product [Pseudo-nitzschia multistriata]